MSTIAVELNGERAQLQQGACVRDAVERAGAGSQPRGVAVAVDGEVVIRGKWETTTLRDGQAVEVVRAVQGG